MNVILVWLAWTGPSALARCTRYLWDTCPALLTLLTVLLEPTRIHQSIRKLIYTVDNYNTGLSKSVDVDIYRR
jgi:hypothetical protein